MTFPDCHFMKGCEMYLRDEVVEGHDRSSNIEGGVESEGEVVGKVIIFDECGSADTLLVSSRRTIAVYFL